MRARATPRRKVPHVEPLWMGYDRQCTAFSRQPVITEGVARVHPLIVEAL